MPFYRAREDFAGAPVYVHLNFGRRRNRTAPPPCREKRADGTVCACITGYQCDWKLGGGRTCDRHLCGAHAHQVAPDKHLCPEHQVAAVAWALL